MSDAGAARASDPDREAAVQRLGRATADGQLTLEELTARTETVYAAKTRGELAKLTEDLPEPVSAVPVARSQVRSRIVTVFGDVTREGSWRAEGTITPITVFGDVELDLRRATVPDDVTIKAYAPHGNIEVLVPDGVQVELSGFTLFGHKRVLVGQAPPGDTSP